MTGNNNWAHLSVEPEGGGHFINHRNQKDIPLAILLILSDELSAWERPRLVHKAEGDDQIVTRLDFENSIILIGMDISDKEKIISISPTAPNDKVKEKFIQDLEGMSCLQREGGDHKLEVLGYKIAFS